MGHEFPRYDEIQRVYLIGSLRNQAIPDIANAIRECGYEVFDDWFAAGRAADEEWQTYEKRRGRTYAEALDGWAAHHVFDYDLTHLNRADIVILVRPCGASGHLEFGWGLGQGKTGYVLFEGEPDRFDVMYLFAANVYTSLDTLLVCLKERNQFYADYYDTGQDCSEAIAHAENEGLCLPKGL